MGLATSQQSGSARFSHLSRTGASNGVLWEAIDRSRSNPTRIRLFQSFSPNAGAGNQPRKPYTRNNPTPNSPKPRAMARRQVLIGDDPAGDPTITGPALGRTRLKLQTSVTSLRAAAISARLAWATSCGAPRGPVQRECRRCRGTAGRRKSATAACRSLLSAVESVRGLRRPPQTITVTPDLARRPAKGRGRRGVRAGQPRTAAVGSRPMSLPIEGR